MEAQAVQSLAEGGGSAFLGIMTLIMWKGLQALQSVALSSSQALDHAKTSALRAERHYDTEEDLYRSMQQTTMQAQATVSARADMERELMSLRAKIDWLERGGVTTGRFRPVDLDSEDTG